MAGIAYTRLLEALKDIGVDVSQQSGSNVKKLFPKNKSTATKPGLLASERDTGGNFATVLDIFREEAKYIDSMNDAEQMAFLNNILDYNEFGGKSIKTSQGIKLLDETKKLTDDAKNMQTSMEDLLALANKMKDDATKSKDKALQDLDDFLVTGGQPLKAKSDKYLGGSMHEEGQLRTAIRTFLQNEYKNGRLKLNDLDKERIMQYSPMTEHDPILVFKKIYGDEAYNKAGSFPGAFEKGESFSHYEKIFRENMGEDLLKVKDKEYVGDGKLILTEAEEVFTPTPDDDDIPFAEGGRASFAGGKLVDEFIAMITKKEPIEAMKEVNKVIGKKGKYKNLTQKDIDRIVEGTEDWIFQRDPDNLYVYDDGTTVWDEDLTKEQLIAKEGRKYDQENIEGTPPPGSRGGPNDIAAPVQSADESLKNMIESELTTLEGIGATKMAERARLKLKYPGITDDLLDKILIDDNPQRKAEVLATIDEAFRMMEKGKGPEEIVEIFKNTKRTKNAKGGRAGYYMGGQSTIEPDLSDIGHGSDSLMARNRILAPNSQATTSTGLNYLLGEDNDNTRIPFNDGLLVPPSKPYTTDMFDKDSMTLLKGIYGTGPDSNKFLYNEIIKKGNILRNQGVERETVIEIIRKNKDKINAFLETQTTIPKTFKGMAMAEGGRIGYAEKGKVSLSDLESLKNLKSERNELGSTLGGIGDLLNRRAGRGLSPSEQIRDKSQSIKDKVITTFVYAADRLDQETKEQVFDLLNGKLKLGYSTTMSGLKQDAFAKTGIVPIDSETLYSAIVDLDLPDDIKLKMSAISDTAGNDEIKASLVGNNFGIKWDNDKQEIIGTANITTKGDFKLTPTIAKDEDSLITKELEINKAIKNGNLTLALNESDIDNSTGMGLKYDNEDFTFNLTQEKGDDVNKITSESTVTVPAYLLKADEKPVLNFELNKNLNTNQIGGQFSGDFPVTENMSVFASQPIDGETNYGVSFNDGILQGLSLDNQNFINYGQTFDLNKYGLQPVYDQNGKIIDYVEDKSNIKKNRGSLELSGSLDYDMNPAFNIFYSKSFGGPQKKGSNFNRSYSGDDFEKIYNIYEETDGFKSIPLRERTQLMAEGGIADLRPGYAGGNIVDKGRRGFLKLLGVTAGGVAALKTGLVKILGKDSGAISKKVIDEVIIDGSSGAPAWLQPLVNKALREGIDKTKTAAYKDAQVVKSLDTPTGKVDVYYDVRTGEVEIDYIGGNTALGESVNMRYTPGMADEGTKGKPADEFEATEAIPEGRGYSYGDDYDFSIDVGENTTDNVKNLFSDTSELAELGGQKPLIKDISETIKKKKVLKQMEEKPGDFIADVQGDFVPD